MEIMMMMAKGGENDDNDDGHDDDDESDGIDIVWNTINYLYIGVDVVATACFFCFLSLLLLVLKQNLSFMCKLGLHFWVRWSEQCLTVEDWGVGKEGWERGVARLSRSKKKYDNGRRSRNGEASLKKKQ